MIWLKVWQFIKPLAPYLLAALAVIAAYGFIYNKGYNAGKDDGYSKAIVETKKIVSKLPDCNCPPVKPCEKIDFDKVKGRNIELTVKQQNTYIVSADSTELSVIIDKQLSRKLDAIPLAKCKR